MSKITGKRFTNWKSGIRRSTVCSTAKERVYLNKVSQNKGGGRSPRAFCESNHCYVGCDAYPTVDERMERLKKLGHCELCLKNDHLQETCVRINCFYCGSGHNSALCRKRNEMKKQSKHFKNGEESKTVVATVADDSIWETYMIYKEHTSPSVRMLTGMVGTRKYECPKITFRVQTLCGNVKNIQAYIVDSILERIHM
uniref:DUF1758 domain-containing protein n=1 Tax=Loa loa TaxID=7209 RepID=A0A1I7W2U9_LOALO